MIFGRKRLPRRLGAFTLIELLIVISIIALLIALLLPTLTRAKETARRVICSSQLHQWSVAYYSYSSSSNGWFPGTVYAELYEVMQSRSPWDSAYYETSMQFQSTVDLFRHYGLTKALTYCPSHQAPMLRPGGSWGGDATLPLDNYDSQMFVDYFIFAGVSCDRASGFGNNPKTINESDTGPFRYCGWDQDGIFEGRYGRMSQNWGPVWKTSQNRRLTTPMFMDSHYLPGSWNNRFYLQWGRLSNHIRSRPSLPNQPIPTSTGTGTSMDAYAVGANAAFLDGSVSWQDLSGPTFDTTLAQPVNTSGSANFVYGGDFFHRFYLNARWYY